MHVHRVFCMQKDIGRTKAGVRTADGSSITLWIAITLITMLSLMFAAIIRIRHYRRN